MNDEDDPVEAGGGGIVFLEDGTVLEGGENQAFVGLVLVAR